MPFARSPIQVAVRSSDWSWLPAAPCTHNGFEELLRELIARARMLRPHLGSRLVSTLLAYGVRCSTLSCEERCGHMIANPVKSTCTSTTTLLLEHAAGCLSGVVREETMSFEEGREIAFSPESTAGSSEARFSRSLSAFKLSSMVIGWCS